MNVYGNGVGDTRGEQVNGTLVSLLFCRKPGRNQKTRKNQEKPGGRERPSKVVTYSGWEARRGRCRVDGQQGEVLFVGFFASGYTALYRYTGTVIA